jgi:hypothetical protein
MFYLFHELHLPSVSHHELKHREALTRHGGLILNLPAYWTEGQNKFFYFINHPISHILL